MSEKEQNRWMDKCVESEKHLTLLGQRIAQQSRTIAEKEKRIEELREALGWMVKLFENSNKGAFSNGVTDQSGMVDQGDVFADRIVNESRALLNARKKQPK